MRKHLIVSIISEPLVSAYFIAFVDKKSDKLGLTGE